MPALVQQLHSPVETQGHLPGSGSRARGGDRTKSLWEGGTGAPSYVSLQSMAPPSTPDSTSLDSTILPAGWAEPWAPCV